ncbi:MAG: hypothetical protein LBD88_03195 [Candidatus Peribacteria bacterium]|jgi:hypothetical protein|nr:hypothetical protein [Candidatus Peribacteria bacterium]
MLSLFFLFSCSIDWKDEKENMEDRIIELQDYITTLEEENYEMEKKLKEDYFQKNLECQKLKDEIISDLEEK